MFDDLLKMYSQVRKNKHINLEVKFLLNANTILVNEDLIVLIKGEDASEFLLKKPRLKGKNHEKQITFSSWIIPYFYALSHYFMSFQLMTDVH